MTLEEKIRKICHDVATPISVVQGFLRAVESKDLTQENREFLDAAKVSLEKLKGLIEELHRLAKSGGS